MVRRTGTSPAVASAAGPYGLVLALVLCAVVVPFVVPDGSPAHVMVTVLHAGTVVAALRAVGAGARERWIAGTVVAGAVLVVVAAAAALAATGSGRLVLTDAAAVVTLVLALYVPVVVLRDIVRHPTITLRTVAAALSIYLLLGLAFSAMHVLIGATVADAYSATLSRSDALYLSFVTLTTVGYGDLVPIADLARGAVVLEAVVGQLYLVAGVALVVGNVGHIRRRDPR